MYFFTPRNRLITKLILKIIFILTVFITKSCKKEPKNGNNQAETNIFTFSNFPTVDSINFENIYELKNKGFPASLHVKDSNLIIFNGGGNPEHLFYNLNIKDNTLSKGYIEKGRGPNELLGAIKCGTIGDEIWIYDITLRKVLILNNNFQAQKELPVEHSFYMISLTDTTTYFGTGDYINPTYKLKEVDLVTGKESNSFGKYSSSEEEIKGYKSAHINIIFKNPEGNKIVLAERYMDAIEVFNVNSSNERSLKTYGPEKLEVSFNPMKVGETYVAEISGTSKYSFINGATTEKYIYLLYSGSLISEEGGFYGKSIFVYDWSGKPVKKFVFDKELLCISVSERDNILYAYDANGGNLIKGKINDEL